MSVRRLLTLVRGLPPEARVRSVDPDRPWTMSTELLAVACELIHMQWTGFYMVNSKKGTKKPKPLVIPRPEGAAQPKKKKRPATLADLHRMFGGPLPAPVPGTAGPAPTEGAVSRG